jgi:hypothetical protein
MKSTNMETNHHDANPQPGAPRGNANHMRHGLSAAKLPKGCEHISNRVGVFRRQLENEVIASHGEIGVYHAALIQSSVRHETRAKLLSRWLRESENEIRTTISKGSANGNGTTPETTVTCTSLGILEKAQLLRDISNASDSRDKCLEKLRLDKAHETAWPMLPALPPPIEQEAIGGTSKSKPDTIAHDGLGREHRRRHRVFDG